MANWGKVDNAANSVSFAPVYVNATANSQNQTDLYGNTTQGAWKNNNVASLKAVGQFGVSPVEMSGSTRVGSVVVDTPGTGFTARPTVAFDNTGTGGSGAAATATGKVVTATINNKGTGGNYIPGETLTAATGTGTAATLNVSSTSVRTIAIAVAGSGYVNGDVITVQSGTGTHANAVVTTGAADTIPASLALANGGIYTVNPTLAAAATANTTGAGAGLTVNLTTKVNAVAIKTAGSYTVLPTLTGDATTGSATGTGATVDLAIGVNDVTLSNNGTSYTTAPVITFGGAGGSGANGHAVLQSSGRGKGFHAGWVLRTEGQGGRAGRITYETLVAMGSITGDGADDAQFPE